jgi:CHAD domain-containing protein
MKKKGKDWPGTPADDADEYGLIGQLPEGSLENLGGALKKQWKRYRKGLNRCQQRFSEKAVHNSRVETRRLLALVELLAGFLTPGRVHKIQLALEQYLDTFGDLRDTQVQMQTVSEMRRTFDAARPFCDYLRKRETRFARQSRKAIKRVKTRRLARLVTAARLELRQGRRQLSRAETTARLLGSLSGAFRATCGLRDQIDAADTRTIHRTRVSFKKFRYMLEALAECVPDRHWPPLAQLREYQTLMGNIQDAEVLGKTYHKFQGKAKQTTTPDRQFQNALARRRKEFIRIYLRAADQLRQFWPPSGRPTETRTARRRPGVRATSGS